MRKPTTRRSFLKGAAAGIVLPAGAISIAGAYPANTKVRHAACGVTGMGGYDLRMLSSSPHSEIVALCDIDDGHLGSAAKLHKKAAQYNDFRKMFDKEHKNIDSCHVTVPDHMHAPITMTALNHGKNVYCQKPLCHEIDEARKIRLAAKKAGVVTQMGIQIHSHVAYRTGVEVIRSGAIGKVRAVHTWADRAWSNGGRPKPTPAPKHVHWDLWLGVAPERPWGPNSYHPKKWWSWLDFGTGNLGDMGCHLFDPVINSIQYGAPTSVRAECRAPEKETWPNAGKVHFNFPETRYTDGNTVMTWYDGGFKKGHHPSPDLLPSKERVKLPSQGSIFIGEKGAMLLPHWSTPKLFPEENFADYKMPEPGSVNHWHSFIDACRGEGKTGASFEYAGPFTETILLGNLAKRFPTQELRWDAPNLKVTNFSEANNFIGRKYRKGWEIDGLSS
ncbi:MAG: Gfo/Idh/MocA family oxidoreductase [Planctomycetota bacterium]|jgi:predicted dehydrogenase|nr:Gfo/Idh/MocA family oxidoreductase [Planctomycetota bacterium]HBO52603.1 dehydrogenase [Planctomycetota bacterium]